MALDSGSNAASSKDIDSNVQDLDDEEDVELSMTGRVSGKTVDQRCPGLRFFDPSLLPGASVSSSVKTDGFCSGAAGPVFVLCLLLFWNALRLEDAARLQPDELPVGNGEFDLQHVVTQEELVKRDTHLGATCGGGVHCRGSALDRGNFDYAGVSPGGCPLQGCPGSRVSRQPGANRFRHDFRMAPLSLGVCPGGPLVRESDRLHAKLECAGETDLPHVVSENFSNPEKLLGAERPRCVPLCGQRVGAKFCEPELQNALVHRHGDPLRGRRGSGRRTGSSTIFMKMPSLWTFSRSLARGCSSACGVRAEGGFGAVRPAQLAEAGSDSCHSFAALFEHCESHIARSHHVNVTLHENLSCSSSCCRSAPLHVQHIIHLHVTLVCMMQRV